MYTPRVRKSKTGVPILKKDEFDAIGEEFVRDFQSEVLRDPAPVDIERFVEYYLGMTMDYLDLRINSKIQQVTALNALATKATSTLTGMPHSPNSATSTMADAIGKIVDLQAEINQDIDELVDLKREISTTIKAVPDTELQTILEKRYLCFQSWEQIAASMSYEIRWLYRLHGKALEAVKSIIDCD